MIVAKGLNPQNQSVILIGLTEEDILDLQKDLTKTKEGCEEYGFSTLIVFMGKSNEAMFELLMKQAKPDVIRRDDLFPNVGLG